MKELGRQVLSAIWHDLKLLRFYYLDTPIMRIWNLIKHTLVPMSETLLPDLIGLPDLKDVEHVDYSSDMPTIVRVQDRLSPQDHANGWGFFIFRYAFDTGTKGVALNESWAIWQRMAYDHMRGRLRGLPRQGRIDDIMDQLSLSFVDDAEMHDFTHDDIRP